MMDRIRETIPDCAVSSDFIVGFCGETDESFEKSVESVREFRFKNSFIFKYSNRPGTKADSLYADDVPDEVKRERNNVLLAEQTRISAEDNAAFIGRRVEVLVEGPSKRALKGNGDGALPGWHGGAAEGVDSDPVVELRIGAVSAGPETRMQLTGRTTCDRIVVFDGNPRLAGSLAEIEIEDCSPTTLLGAIVTRQVQHGSSALLPILS
jgi:tRNA-2-methylthio-N6-dimethylallyladenosine synthase